MTDHPSSNRRGGSGGICIAHVVPTCIVAVLLLFATGCATVGPVPATLSAEVGDRIAEMQGLHQLALQKYFDSERRRIEDFLEREWIPLYLRNFLGLSGLMQDLQEASSVSEDDRWAVEEALKDYLIDDVEAPAAASELIASVTSTRQQESEAVRGVLNRYVEDARVDEAAVHVSSLLNVVDPGFLILEWAQAAREAIERQRREMLLPLDEAERQASAELAQAYADLLKANGVVTARLEAASKVNASQDQLLQTVGTRPYADSLRLRLAHVSSTVGEALGAARTAMGQSSENLESTATRTDNAIRALSETLQLIANPSRK